MGNNKTTDYETVDPADLLQVTISGTSGNTGTTYYADLEYVGGGLFKGTYIPLRSGKYKVSIQMGGPNGRDIYCGLG